MSSRFSPRVAGENDFLQTVINKVIAAKEVNHKGQGTYFPILFPSVCLHACGTVLFGLRFSLMLIMMAVIMVAVTVVMVENVCDSRPHVQCMTVFCPITFVNIAESPLLDGEWGRIRCLEERAGGRCNSPLPMLCANHCLFWGSPAGLPKKVTSFVQTCSPEFCHLSDFSSPTPRLTLTVLNPALTRSRAADLLLAEGMNQSPRAGDSWHLAGQEGCQETTVTEAPPPAQGEVTFRT